MPEYPPEKLQEIYNALPGELQEALFSEENTKNIEEACKDNGVENYDATFDIKRTVGYALMGLLNPNDLREALEYELKIPREQAQKISWSIARFVFAPVKKTLEKLYGTVLDISQPQGMTTTAKKAGLPATEASPDIEISSDDTFDQDRYREPIE